MLLFVSLEHTDHQGQSNGRSNHCYHWRIQGGEQPAGRVMILSFRPSFETYQFFSKFGKRLYVMVRRLLHCFVGEYLG